MTPVQDVIKTETVIVFCKVSEFFIIYLYGITGFGPIYLHK